MHDISKLQITLIVVLLYIIGFLSGVVFYRDIWSSEKEEPVKPIVNIYITVPESTNPEEIEIKSDAGQDEEAVIYQAESKQWTYDDAEYLAKMAYGESRGVPVLNSQFGVRSNAYQNACTMWTVLNRVDAEWGTIEEVVTAKNQFVGYKSSNPVDPDLLDLAFNILGDWSVGKETLRTLPKEYLYFRGDGKHNYFRTQNGEMYDWHLPDPFV